jgi:hypothetical protein
MGPERDFKDPDRGPGSTPKLRLAGRIDGAVDGRPVNLVAETDCLVLNVGSWRTLLTKRRSSRSLLRALRVLLTPTDIRVFVRLWWWGRVEVHPRPSVAVRMLLSPE